VRQCGRLEKLVWETALGGGGDLWEVSVLPSSTRLDRIRNATQASQAISQQGSLRRLVIIPAPLHPALDPAGSRNFPRITPELQVIRGESDLQIRDETGAAPTAGRAICGGDGLGLGTGWDGLEELTLSGLSQAGVSGQLSASAVLTVLNLVKVVGTGGRDPSRALGGARVRFGASSSFRLNLNSVSRQHAMRGYRHTRSTGASHTSRTRHEWHEIHGRLPKIHRRRMHGTNLDPAQRRRRRVDATFNTTL
jgi:hypothetical protein